MIPLVILAEDRDSLSEIVNSNSLRKIVIINDKPSDTSLQLYIKQLEMMGIEIISASDIVDFDQAKKIVSDVYSFEEYEIKHTDGRSFTIKEDVIDNFPFPLTEEQRQIKGIKLHLGCGNIYLNDFLNIDLDNNVADENSDVSKLKYKDNSISLILASHLIEHFAWNEHIPVLKEWYRVLKPGCWLIVEAPNLEESCKHFLEEQDDANRIAVVFPQIFGRPDFSRGNIHLSGVWPRYLRKALEYVGFKEIRDMKPIENSIRKRCLRIDAKK